MQFQALLKANFPAAILSGGAAVFFGYLGFGVWALIGQMIISSVLISIFLWMNSSWRPQCLFSFSSLNEIYNYSYKLFLSSLLDTIYKNIFVVIIAKSFSVAVAGLYFFADRVKELFITQLITSIQSVTFPALSAIQDDTERLQQAYRKIMKVMTFLVFPVLFLFAALADTLFQIFLPDKWLQAVPYLQLMILSCLFTPIISINLNIIKIKGCSGWYLLLEVIKKLTGGIILFFTFKYGVEAMLIGQIISLALNYYPSVYLSNKLVRYNFIHQLSDFMPNLLLSAFVALSTWWLQFYLHYPPLVEFVLFGSFSIIFFIAGAYILKLESLRLTWEMLRNIKNNKRKY
jgi:O-antigen/teichoic acid export membrane protein